MMPPRVKTYLKDKYPEVAIYITDLHTRNTIYTNWTRVAKSAFKKSNFRDARDLLWQPEWTESECAKANSLHRIYDAGKTRWKKVLP